MKPVRGGRPPSDRRTRGARVARAGVFAHEAASELIFVDWFSLKIINMEKVITKYVTKAIRVREGEN